MYLKLVASMHDAEVGSVPMVSISICILYLCHVKICSVSAGIFHSYVFIFHSQFCFNDFIGHLHRVNCTEHSMLVL
jgi:hypothetical protein